MSGFELIAAGTLGEGVGAVTLADALVVAGTAISAGGAIGAGQAAQRRASFESAQLQVQADRDREIAAQNAADFRDNESRRRATLRARVAGSGTTLEGSSLAVLSDLASEAEFQALRIESGGETAASRAGNQAALRRLEGRNARSAGFTRAGGTLLTGAGKAIS